MSFSVRYAKHLESDVSESVGTGIIGLNHSFGSSSLKLGKLLDALSKRSVLDGMEGQTNPSPFFQRSPFRPNYETNSVFFFSILQSAISALVSHKGAPFYRSVLESRDLCAMAGGTLLFVMVCITGKMSSITNFLQVKPLPSRFAKVVFLGIVMINIMACAFCRLIMDTFLFTSTSAELVTVASEGETQSKNAADHEEKLLSEEIEYNLKGLRFFCVLIAYVMIDVIFSPK
jgi:hypothetical protein